MPEINLLTNYKPIQPKTNYIPLISISGISLLSLGGIVLLKSRNTAILPPPTGGPSNQSTQNDPQPTQVPKSIQHYLLASQQNFTQAITATDEKQKIELINQSIIAASNAIKEFPQDYRGYHQRGRIYQSLIDSQPQFIDQAISDFASAYKLNNNSAEIARDLATIYAKKGDAQNTIAYLVQTVSLEPTKAQNFYDLAKIQQQAGYFSDALTTYNQLLTLITDPAQRQQLETEKQSLENIISQNPNTPKLNLPPTIENPKPNLDSPTIQATDILAQGIIIAAPETEKKIEVSNQTESNSLSGSSTLSSGQTSITLNNTQITNSTQVYVTITNNIKGVNLKVLSKSNGSFTVGIDQPIQENIEFKWWLIN